MLHSTKNLNSPSPKSKNFATKTYSSPFKIFKKDYKYIDYMKSSDTSIETFGKFSSEEVNDSEEYTLESPLLLSIKKNFPDTVEYEHEIGARRQENTKLKSKIEQFHPRPSESPIYENGQVKNALKKQKERLEKDFQVALHKQKKDLSEEFQREFEMFQDQLVNKTRAQQQKIFQAKEKDLQDSYKYEKNSLEKELDCKYKQKISELTGDFEKQLERFQDESTWLRRQNEKLKKELEEKSELVNNRSRYEGVNSVTIDLSRQYNEICRSYNELQHDYLELKKQKTSNMCVKCKAFTDTNDELSSKISRIRAYINSKN